MEGGRKVTSSDYKIYGGVMRKVVVIVDVGSRKVYRSVFRAGAALLVVLLFFWWGVFW